MLKAFCDRCTEEIPDYDAEKNTLDIVFGGMAWDHFDLCPICLGAMKGQLSDLIKGELD